MAYVSDSDEEAPHEAPQGSVQTRRRAANAELRFRTISACFFSFVKPIYREQIVDTVEQWVHTVHHVILEAHLFINLHVIRCLEEGIALPDKLGQTFFLRACAAVSHAVLGASNTAWQAEDGFLQTYHLYRQCRPQGPLEGYLPAERRPEVGPVSALSSAA